MQGEAGFIPASQEFMEGLRSICDREGILLVVDEVQTGFGRTGRMFAVEHFGVEPDLLMLAKSIAGGLPLSAVVGKAEIMDSLWDNAVGGTYVGNPVALAAAVAVLDVFEEEGLVERAQRIGETIRARMLAWQERFDAIGDVRGLGAMLAVEYVEDRETKEPAPANRVARRRGGGPARAAAPQGRHPLELQPRPLPARHHGRRARGGARGLGGGAGSGPRVAAPACSPVLAVCRDPGRPWAPYRGPHSQAT